METVRSLGKLRAVRRQGQEPEANWRWFRDANEYSQYTIARHLDPVGNLYAAEALELRTPPVDFHEICERR